MRSVVIVLACLHVALGGGVGDVYVNSVGYGPAAAVGYGPAVGYAAPAAAVGYAAPGAAVGYATQAAAVGYAAPAAAVGYAAAPAVGYAAAPAAAVGYAAVPTVHHVQGVADVPVTRLEAQHAVVQHEVDVAHPAVSTRKFEVRRPAIQKQFYDIEERVVIRPAGSAVVELDQPTSKLQRGPAVVTPLAAGHGPVAVAAPAPVAVAAPAPVAVASPAPVAVAGPAPGPVFVSSTPAPPQFDSDDTLVVENAGLEAAQRLGPQPQPLVRSHGAPLEGPVPDVIPSLRSADPHENQANQQRLIQLLTARGGVTEVGFGREGPAEGPVGDAGQVRARVLSATPSPSYAAPAGERVSTRRVVVSRPIETLQEVDVLEPVTKLQRVAVQTPTVVKTLRQDVARVATSVPVYGKTLTPVAAHVGYY